MAHGRPRKEICYKCEMYGLTPRFSKSACPNCKGDVEQISLDGLKEILKTTSNFFPLSFTWISFNTDDRTIQLNDDDMKTAVERIIEMNGGLAAACDRKISAELALPIAGLMSDKSLEAVRSQMDAMINAAHSMGTVVPDPFMILSFLALPVIPELKLTDQGLFDVNQFKHVSLFVD